MTSLVRQSVALVLLLSGCWRNSSPPATAVTEPPFQTAGDPATLRYAPELGVDLGQMTQSVSGLYYRDLQLGSGAEARPGQRVQVAYKGWLADGRLFDESPAGQPYGFRLGRGLVIRGWDEGVAGMKTGGRRLLVIPPSLAYGDMSPGAGIPPNATLIFDVRLVAAQ